MACVFIEMQKKKGVGGTKGGKKNPVFSAVLFLFFYSSCRYLVLLIPPSFYLLIDLPLNDVL